MTSVHNDYNYTVTATPVGDSPTGGQPFAVTFDFFTDDVAKTQIVTDFVKLLESSPAIVNDSVDVQRLDVVQTNYTTDMTTDPVTFN